MKKLSRFFSICIALVLTCCLLALPAYAADTAEGSTKVLSGIGNDNGGNGNHTGEYNQISNFLMNYGNNGGGDGIGNGTGDYVEDFLTDFGSHNGNNQSHNGSNQTTENFLMNYDSHNGGNGSRNGSGTKMILDVGDLVNINSHNM